MGNKTACLFTGQGSQFPGMGKMFYENDKECRAIFDMASEVFGYDMADICFNGDKETLRATTYSQPTVLVVDLCAYEIAKKKGYSFKAMAGFSLGEYAVLAASNVLSVMDTFKLVKARVEAMNAILNNDDYSMLAVYGKSVELYEQICKSIRTAYIEIANYNSPVQVSLGGSKKGIEAYTTVASAFNMKCVPIKVNRPFHTMLMKPAADIFREEISKYKFSEPDVAVYSNVTGDLVTEVDEIKENLVKQIYSPVKWTDIIYSLKMLGIDQYVECGPKRILGRFVEETLGFGKKSTSFIEM